MHIVHSLVHDVQKESLKTFGFTLKLRWVWKEKDCFAQYMYQESNNICQNMGLTILQKNLISSLNCVLSAQKRLSNHYDALISWISTTAWSFVVVNNA